MTSRHLLDGSFAGRGGVPAVRRGAEATPARGFLRDASAGAGRRGVHLTHRGQQSNILTGADWDELPEEMEVRIIRFALRPCMLGAGGWNCACAM